MSSLKSRALSGVLWMVVQTWLVRITTVGSFVILSRHLSPAEFGLVSLAMAVIAVLAMLSDSGMATFLVRRSDVSPAVLSTALWTSVALATALALVLALLAGPASALFDERQLAPVLRWLSIGVLLTGLSSVPSALLKRDMRFKELAVRGVVATTSGSVVAVALALAGAGVWALVAQSLVRGAVAVVVIWSASGWRPSWSWDRQQAGEMLRFGVNLLSIDLLMQARDRGEEFTLAAVSGATTLGYWSVASRLVKILQEVSSSVISSVATPAFAKLQHEPERLYRAYATSMASAGLVLFPLMLFLSITSPDLVPLLLGEQWATTASVAQITALTAVIGVFSYFDRTVFVAFGRLRPEVLLVAGIVALHTAIVVTVAHYGLLVLAIALAVRALVTFPVRQFVLHRYAGVPYRALLPACRVLVAALLMAAAVLGTSTALQDDGPWLRLVLCAGVAAVTYPPFLLLLARPVVLPLLRDVVAARRRARPRGTTVAPAVVDLAVPRQVAPRTPEEVRR